MFHRAYRMYKTRSVAFQAGLFLLALYRPEKVLNLDVLVSTGLLLCVTHSRALIAKTCQKTMMEFSSPFSRVYLPTECVCHDETVLVCLMWQCDPISFLSVCPAVTQLCFSLLSPADTSVELSAYQIHMAAQESQHSPDTGKWKKHNNTWFMAGTALSDNIHGEILENTLTFKIFSAFSDYFTNPS